MRKPGLQWSPPPRRPVTWGVQPQRHNITRECEIEEAVAIAQVSKKGKNHRFFFPLREIKYLVRSTRAVCAGGAGDGDDGGARGRRRAGLEGDGLGDADDGGGDEAGAGDGGHATA